MPLCRQHSAFIDFERHNLYFNGCLSVKFVGSRSDLRPFTVDDHIARDNLISLGNTALGLSRDSPVKVTTEG